MNAIEPTRPVHKKVEPIFYGWIIVLASFLAMFAFGTLNALGVFIDPLTREFGWSKAGLSMAFSIYFVMFTFPAFFMGGICDRQGIRKVISIGAALTGAGLLLCSQVSSLIQLYLYFGIIGFGISTVFVPSTSTIQRWFVKKRGAAIGFALTASGFGMFIFSPLTEIFITDFGWRSTFLIYGFFVLTTLLISSLLFRQKPSDVGLPPYGCDTPIEPRKSEETNQQSIRKVLKRKSFWYLFGIMVITHVSYFMFSVHVVPHAIDLGISGIAAAGALTVAGIFNIPAKIVAGLIFDRFKGANWLAIFVAIQMISAFTLIVSNDIWLIYFTSALMGIGYGCWTVVLTVIVSDHFGTKNLGAIFGLLDSGVGIGGILGPYFAGYIFDLNGNYYVAFLFAAILMIMAVLLSILLRKE